MYQAHPGAGKEERKSLWRLIDPRKLSAEAAAHAVQNDRLPVQCSALQEQVERLGSERRRRGGGVGVGGFKWSTLWFGGGGMGGDVARPRRRPRRRGGPPGGASPCHERNLKPAAALNVY
ncbi:unnamed protein product [Triticum turgidum subsp. durum]|uniref:NPH3 domain-containing protein n=1 Tax=Triticum turgidum subsp. durum TaxID=4567 RepID=A0A9R0VH77_TRITD|nr:unnamed protein product [Triticum turgidum subsp. durum]